MDGQQFAAATGSSDSEKQVKCHCCTLPILLKMGESDRLFAKSLSENGRAGFPTCSVEAALAGLFVDKM